MGRARRRCALVVRRGVRVGCRRCRPIDREGRRGPFTVLSARSRLFLPACVLRASAPRPRA
eukprot:2989631-Prymnesium_polylepis.1